MKKLFALLAVVLAVVSCQRDADDLNVAMGGEQEVMLTVSLPEATRANSAQGFDLNKLGTTYDLRYILEIYRVKEGTVLYDTCQRFVETSDGNTMAFPVRLAPGYDYRVAAWADIVDEGSKADRCYTTTDGLDAITIIENEWKPMDETRDAYTGLLRISDFGNANASTNYNITLQRPFAKIRVVATDIADIRKVGLEPTKAEMSYSEDMYRTFNAVADTKINETDRSNAAERKDVEYTYVQEYYEAYSKDAAEFTLFTDYIFVPANGIAKFSLKVYADENKSMLIKGNNFNTDIFVERNKLTTIKGDVLTTGGNVSVKVESGLEEFKTITIVDTAESLQEVINNIEEGDSANIELGGDIDLSAIAGILSTRANETAGLVIPANKTVVLDLNGHSISQEKECSASYSMIENKGNLTILDSSENKTGKISFKDTSAGDPSFGWGSYTLRNEGTLLVKSGTIEHLGEQDAHMICAIFQYSGSSTINGGRLSTPYYRSARLWKGDMTINGGEFEGQLWLQAVDNTANLTINGGTFAPRGGDYSSVFVSNIDTSGVEHNVSVSVTGGHFTTKIGMYKPFACITGGTFTTVAKEGTNAALINDDLEWTEAENGNWTLTRKPDVAKIGEVGYTSLQKAVAAVEDGGTITLVANEVFTETNRYNNSGWWDGLGYSGDKSFTIDLNNYTISQSQDGVLNDYLIWVKNDGAKGNTITLKNGTLDAGKTAYCAFATASSNKQKITINLENIELKGNNSNGAVAKIRGGAELNVKAGTVINGLNNYVGIECVNSTTNIYEGAKIYQKGTSSSWGCLVGVSGNGTVNVYGGKGTSARGGFIAMTSGGTINVAGGEWIANVDGTYASDNKGILIAQSDKQYNAGAGDSIINVTGGTFKGGYNCYGNKAGDAQINIMGGNFNSDPSSYLAEGCEAKEANGVWAVRVIPVAKIGNVEYETLEAAAAAAKAGDTIILNKDVTLSAALTMPAGIILNGNGKQIDGKKIIAGGNLTIIGDTKIKTLEAVNGGTITIEDGKTLVLNNFSFGSKDTANAVYEIKGGTITANYGFFQHGKYALYSNFETGYMYYSFGSDITVYGTFHSQGKGDGLDYVRGKLTIAEGGKSIHDKSLWVGQPASWGAMNASLIIEAGGYVQANSLSVYEGSSLTYSNDADLKYNSVTGTEYITKK